MDAPFGHFTAMQVRGGGTRGLALHLARLDATNRELFGAPLDGDEVRARVREALGETADGSVRVYVAESGGAPHAISVTVKPPAGPSPHPVALQRAPYVRTAPHIKRIGDFGQAYYRLLAHRDGFDDALLTAPDGGVSECGISNIGFWDGEAVVWPDVPFLDGIGYQLLAPRLAAGGLDSRTGRVDAGDLAPWRGAFVLNARGIAPVGRIDDVQLPVDGELMAALHRIYDAIPFDPI